MLRSIRVAFLLLLFAGSLASELHASNVTPTDEQILLSAGISVEPDAVTRALANRDAFIRKSAANLLGKWRTTAAIPELKQVLDDDLAFVAISAAGALLRMGDKSGVPLLTAELRDTEVTNVMDAARHLLDAADKQGFEILKARLASGKVAPLDRLLIVRFFAYAMRVPSLREEAEALVIKALLGDDDHYVRGAAAEDLAQYQSPAIVRAFQAIVRNEETDPFLREQAKAYLKKEATRRREE